MKNCESFFSPDVKVESIACSQLGTTTDKY